MSVELSHEEMLRYNRQIVLRDFDFDGQEKLKASRVLIVGLGGLGCAAAPYLASAGVGHLALLDFDSVSLSNLQRQILHSDATLGQPKVESARQRLAAINPHCQLEPIDAQLDDAQLSALIARHDAVLDCTDNVSAREQINRLCYQHKVPLISGAAIRMEGQLSVFTWQQDEPCYRCISRLFGDQTLSCVEAGVLAPLVGVIGAMQALEAIKVLTALGQPARARLLIYDAMSAEFRNMKVMQDRHCEVCGEK
ncbi:molybdopterin-synthase adenylyltransferase MoeB [Pantoea sp. Taur]|uniref:molybdopterin-synthase adenylyltransferase MoeB n=1 Tax=Pantoea sp. Taur TaxID=2576757 RepID=UPI0013535F12|nr:molybdopterin-synthase adenylyltransferase MoeB [Pantoea sp. Taur]MXP61366.1 molybdopterin-synthase adenylyltransferase MoeB [Pantoea sp. Taur]